MEQISANKLNFAEGDWKQTRHRDESTESNSPLVPVIRAPIKLLNHRPMRSNHVKDLRSC